MYVAIRRTHGFFRSFVDNGDYASSAVAAGTAAGVITISLLRRICAYIMQSI